MSITYKYSRVIIHKNQKIHSKIQSKNKQKKNNTIDANHVILS